MYHHYKPLRNFISKLDRNAALLQICRFFQNIKYGESIPLQFSRIHPKGKCSIKGVVFPWELDILAREVILNAGVGGTKNLFELKDFASAVGKVRKLQDQQVDGRLEKMIFQEMHRIIQQQFPWQQSTVELRLARYFRIYRAPEVEALLEKETGLTIKKFYLLGMAVAGAFISKNSYDLNSDFTQIGISDQQRDSFFNLIVMDFEPLRARTKSVQEYNENWSYTINPLQSTPLVRVFPEAPNIVICPVPHFILSRVSEGLFFDLGRIEGFENPYGAAVESYVGEISEELITSNSISIKAGEEYLVKKNKKDGVDWYVFDDEAAILVECKSKRLGLQARYQLEEGALHNEVNYLAKFVVQNYKNLSDVVAGHTPWKQEGRKLFPVVLTLSNWYLFGPSIFQKLEDAILSLLDKAGLDRKMTEEYPYTIMSIEEYEIAVQVISQVGLHEFFDERAKSEHKGWMVSPFMDAKYPEFVANARFDYLRSELNFIVDDLDDNA